MKVIWGKVLTVTMIFPAEVKDTSDEFMYKASSKSSPKEPEIVALQNHKGILRVKPSKIPLLKEATERVSEFVAFFRILSKKKNQFNIFKTQK